MMRANFSISRGIQLTKAAPAPASFHVLGSESATQHRAINLQTRRVARLIVGALLVLSSLLVSGGFSGRSAQASTLKLSTCVTTHMPHPSPNSGAHMSHVHRSPSNRH